MKFHYELLNKNFTETSLKILAKVRGVALPQRRKVKALFHPLVSNSSLQQDIEDKLLYLIQLWYDTFMMHEDEFKEVITLYKQLRKEGVVFPPRDPNEKFMIQFKGKVSPIFQTIEENKVYEEPQKQFKMSGHKLGTKDFISASYGGGGSSGVSSSSQNQNKPKYIGQNYEARAVEERREIEEEIDDATEITAEEIIIIRESCLLLDDIMTNAQHLNELRGEVAMEVIENHEVSLKKLKKLFNTTKNFESEEERNVR